MTRDPKLYLDYLDKEMTIMGLLSTFSIGGAAFVLDRILSAEKGMVLELRDRAPAYLCIGLLALLASSLFFYRQRSLLAYYYGQISLAAVGGGDENVGTVEEKLREANAWITWFSYQEAFALLTVAAAALCLSFAACRWDVVMLDPVRGVAVSLLSLIPIVFGSYNYARLRRNDHKRA